MSNCKPAGEARKKIGSPNEPSAWLGEPFLEQVVRLFASETFASLIPYANGNVSCKTPDCRGCSMGWKDRYSDIDIEEMLSEKQ
jgi:hypothetical protein